MVASLSRHHPVKQMKPILQRKCAKCGTYNRPTRHHLFPKCMFGDGPRVTVCRSCHNKLENLISELEGMVNGKRIRRQPQFYVDCLIKFLTE